MNARLSRPASSAIAVRADLPRTGSLDRAALERLAQTEVTQEHDGVAHRYRGVLLDAVLRDFGFSEGRSQREVPGAQKRNGWRKVVVATGADGYQAAFSCAELSSDMGCTSALLAYAVDDHALPDGEGPFRLIVSTDRKGARSVRNLIALEVVDAGRRE
jgi:hypothetical protein